MHFFQQCFALCSFLPKLHDWRHIWKCTFLFIFWPTELELSTNWKTKFLKTTYSISEFWECRSHPAVVVCTDASKRLMYHCLVSTSVLWSAILKHSMWSQTELSGSKMLGTRRCQTAKKSFQYLHSFEAPSSQDKLGTNVPHKDTSINSIFWFDNYLEPA